MSDTTTTADTQPVADTAGHDAHPSDGHYIKIALFLAALTAAETSTYFISAFEDNSALLLGFLMPVMTLKFGMVAWYFMHLKSDSRLFTRLFLVGVVSAVVIYMVVLLTFDEFF